MLPLRRLWVSRSARSAVALATSALALSPSQDGSSEEAPQLESEQTTPSKIFFSGTHKVEYRYALGGSTARDLEISVLRRNSEKVVRVWRQAGVEPGAEQVIRWGGRRSGGRPAPRGKYLFRVEEEGGEAAEPSETKTRRVFETYPHKFPIRARHTYGDGVGAGRGHQGQDIFAKCGAKLVAARAGEVQWRSYDGGGAGYYVVIDGKGTEKDYVYMHMARKGLPREGERVRTGERIGYVSDTGNASDCHLHFELWSAPGWYDGGSYLDPKKKLKRWDRWS